MPRETLLAAGLILTREREMGAYHASSRRVNRGLMEFFSMSQAG